jgi:hypothetical protein
MKWTKDEWRQESEMKTFVDAQIEHAPSNVKLRRASRAINPLVTCAVITFVGFLASLACAVPSFAQIVGTVQLNIERRGHTATLLEDGKVLIVGGDNESGIVNQVELLDPTSQTSSLAAMPIVGRTDHTATRLADGRVLIIGGRDQTGSLTSTEIYDPLTATFTAGPSLTTPRSGHTATVLANGNILVAGGDASGSAELYNPTTQSFSLIAGGMNTARKFQSAILLNNGQVLIAGGVGAQNNVLNTAEVYDPSSQSFYLPPTDMQTPRALATLKLLADGKVQIIGGDAELSMEVFDPTNGIFIAKALLPPNADLLGATVSTQSRAALFSPTISQDPLLQGVLTPEQLALLDRADHSITELPSRNQALVAGGINSGGQTLNTATLVSSSTASVTTDKTDYAPGQIVTITGNGFQPNEQVDIYFHEFPEEYPDIFRSVAANQQGNFVTADFAPQQIDLGRIFTVTATGQSSGFTAQTAFKDATNIDTSTTLNTISSPLTAGQTGVTFSGTVSPNSSTDPPVPNGSPVQLTRYSSTACTGSGTNLASTTTTSGNGSFSGTFTAPAGGIYGVRAEFPQANQGGGSGTNWKKSDSGCQTITVNASAAATTLTVSAASGAYGGTTTLFATLKKTSDNSPVSGKTITFTLNGSSFAGNTAVTDSSGVASLSGASLIGINANTYFTGVGASFAGDSSFASSSGTNSLTINKKDATWTTNPASKTYGDLDPSPLTTGDGSGFVDAVTATYSRVAGETVAGSPYHISATLNAAAGILNNYNITNAGADFTINKKDATWTTNPASKTYGDPDPSPLTTGSGNGFLMADGVSATYARTSGENASPPTYHITAALSATVPGALNNYNITNAGADFTINKRPITVTADAKTKTYGDADPALTYQVSSGSLAFTDAFTGALSRVAGELVGTYAIQQNTLSINNSGNYNLTYVGGDLTITTVFAFNGFYSPIGGSVETGDGGSYANPVKSFKLGSTIPVKFGATWLNGGAALITGIHTLQAVKYSNSIDSDPPIDATPTDAATTGNQFRLTSPDWHFNISTKEFSAGTWLLIATLEDGSKHTVWISIKK